MRLKNAIGFDPTRRNRIWSDTHLRDHPGFHGNPRATLSAALDKFQFNFLDHPSRRLAQTDIWDRYLNYDYVISLPGHGLDCHRTWEALGLGAVVITVHSPLDDLLKGYRVIFLDAREPRDWLILDDRDWLAVESKKCIHKPIPTLSWDYWLTRVREPLRQFVA